jgi:hypothetical protein
MLLTGAAMAGTAALAHGQTAPSTIQSSNPGGGTTVDPNAGPYPPGEPGKNYTPVVTPDGATLPFKIVDGVKVFHLVAEPCKREFAPGLVVDCWGYNGITPGPTIEAVEGDRVRIFVTNKLPAPTTVHWHGILVPNGMDGVSGLTQKPIDPGETFKYEFTLRQYGTFMYHPHFDEMTDFNIFTMNSKVYPGTSPLVVRTGQRVRIRLGNLGAMDHHPIHIHGFNFRVTGTDGGPIHPSAWWPETSVLVAVGSTRDAEFVADAPGDWALHCHMSHHTMNQMGHGLPNMVGVDPTGLAPKVRPLLPGYMTMGQTGMGGMGEHMQHMGVPANSIPMVGGPGPFAYIDMGGMFTVLKVRAGSPGYEDPGWYEHPQGSVASVASEEAMRRDGIDPARFNTGPDLPTPPAQLQLDQHRSGHQH